MTRKEIRIEDITILIDTREQRPLDFFYGPADAKKRVNTETATLSTGDYSIKGFEKLIAIERKSLDDLCGVIGNSRKRFESEIERLLSYPCRLIVVEADWDQIEAGQYRSKLTPKQIKGSIQGWIDKGVPFFFHHNRQIISEFVGNLMFIRARRTFDIIKECIPNLKVISETKDV